MHTKWIKTINASNFDECLFNGQFTIGAEERTEKRERGRARSSRRGKINKENGLHAFLNRIKILCVNSHASLGSAKFYACGHKFHCRHQFVNFGFV